MIGFSLLLWTSLCWIGGVSADCYSNFSLKLNSEESNEGWNGLGRGFLGIFMPDKMTDKQWEIIGEIYDKKDFSLIKKFAYSLGGIVFLEVVSAILLICFCAAPCSLCVFSCTCKKKCKPKTNNIITYTGIGCNCVAMLTIFLAILFCILSIGSITDGVGRVGDSIKPFPDQALDVLTKLAAELLNCGVTNLLSLLADAIDDLPAKISDKMSELKEIKDVLKIDFKKYQATIDEFSKKTGEINIKIDAAKNKLTDLNKQNLLDPPLANLDEAKKAISAMNSKLDSSASGDDSIKKKLDKAEEHRSKASKSEIKKTVKDKLGGSQLVENLNSEITNQINNGINSLKDEAKEKASSMTNEISSKTHEFADKLSFVQAINLVFLPCCLALISVIWSTYAASRFVPKKTAKPKEKIGLLIPLAIGLPLAFFPLFFSTIFMDVAGMTNMACGTFFKDDSFGFLPKAMAAFKVNPVRTFGGHEMNIQSVIQECRNETKSLLTAVNAGSFVGEDLFSKIFDPIAEKAKAIQKLDDPFGLAGEDDWKATRTTIDDIKKQREDAVAKIDFLQNFAPVDLPPPDGRVTVAELAEVKAVVEAVKAFSVEVKKFEEEVTADIGIAEKVKEELIRRETKNVVNGEPGKLGFFDEMVDILDDHFRTFRGELITNSTNCNFIFTLFDSFGEIFCYQTLGGLNGVYAAIGLGVLSFISATCGTVMIWHSLRAGKGVEEEEKQSTKKSGKGEGGEGEGDTLRPVPAEMNMSGKVGEVAQPMQIKPQQDGAQAPAVVQAVPTDKTNPSLLPNDALPSDKQPAAGASPINDPAAGTPLSPDPMVKKEDKDDKQKPGAGGETQGGAATPQ